MALRNQTAGLRLLAPLLLVFGAVLFNLWTLRAERLPVSNPNDAPLHISMIGWAMKRWAGGHLPLDGWYPDLAFGNAQFHFYQSLPHVLSGLFALLVGKDQAFSWTLYLLLAFWPLCVFWTVRLLGWGRWEAALSAAVSPLVLSFPGYGYEYSSYTWRGLGVWTQLWGMWFLPLSWGFAWRAISGRGSYVPAVLTTVLAIACHFLTGYLALLSIGVLFLIKPSEWRTRLRRAGLVLGGSILAASWVIIPLLADSMWANHTSFAGTVPGSHGASKVLGWLVTGELFDSQRFPAITLLVAAGAGICVMRFQKDERARAILALSVLSLLLFFGRPTLGALLDLLPGGEDLIYRRFIMGVHLGGIILAGVGAAGLGRVVRYHLKLGWPAIRPAALEVTSALVALGLVWPALSERAQYHALGRQWIREQQAADNQDGSHFAALVETAMKRPGRIYAGSIWGDHWGESYKIGRVPAYASLLQLNADAVGFVTRTLSISSDIEVLFDEAKAAHFDLFNVRFMILPPNRKPKVPATLVQQRGRHSLWEVKTSGYLDLVDSLGPAVTADRTNIYKSVGPYVRSNIFARKRIFPVAFGGRSAAPPTLTAEERQVTTPPGTVQRQNARLADGMANAEVRAARKSVLVLKSTFDPHWRATIDGKEADSYMVTPTFTGVTVPPGNHSVQLFYRPFQHLWLLLLLAGLTLFGLGALERRESKRNGDEQPLLH